jgi:hypothetical protein
LFSRPLFGLALFSHPLFGLALFSRPLFGLPLLDPPLNRPRVSCPLLSLPLLNRPRLSLAPLNRPLLDLPLLGLPTGGDLGHHQLVGPTGPRGLRGGFLYGHKCGRPALSALLVRGAGCRIRVRRRPHRILLVRHAPLLVTRPLGAKLTHRRADIDATLRRRVVHTSEVITAKR